MEPYLRVKIVPFKEIYILEGIDSWWKNRPDLLDRGLRSKYKKNTPLKFRRNRSHIQNVNVYVDNMLIGFVNFPKSLKILQAIEHERTLHGRICEVTHSECANLPPTEVRMEVSTFRRRVDEKLDKTNKRRKASSPEEVAKKHNETEAQPHPRYTVKSTDLQAHRITGAIFSKQPIKSVPARKHRKKMGIYCLWSDTHETYIGQSTDIGQRINSHVNSLEAGSHQNSRLREDWKRKGQAKFRFDVVQIVENREILDELENYYICEYHTYTHGYNATPDGQAIAGYKSFKKEKIKLHQASDTDRAPQAPKAREEYSVSSLDRANFTDLFDGRYYSSQFTRTRDEGIVRIFMEDEVWCYVSDSEYHAELLVRWFAKKRSIKGSAFDWIVDCHQKKDEK